MTEEETSVVTITIDEQADFDYLTITIAEEISFAHKIFPDTYLLFEFEENDRSITLEKGDFFDLILGYSMLPLTWDIAKEDDEARFFDQLKRGWSLILRTLEQTFAEEYQAFITEQKKEPTAEELLAHFLERVEKIIFQLCYQEVAAESRAGEKETYNQAEKNEKGVKK